MATSPKDPQIERFGARAAQMIVKAREVARETLGEAAAGNETVVVQIASMMMSREAAELIGFELAADRRKGK